MKLARRLTILVLVLIMSLAVALPVHARGRGRGAIGAMQGATITTSQQFFTSNGTAVNWQGGFTQNDTGWMFGRGCWYIDADGNVVSVWGHMIYDADGNPIPRNWNDWGAWCPWDRCWRW